MGTPQPRAHPRSRGENHHSRRARGPWLGSSPLTRGKRCRGLPRRQQMRLIPAHAGKTWGRWTVGGPTPAHPRSRGENLMVTCARASDEGSSPLTRGKHVEEHRDDVGIGLIPAHAGKTSSSRRTGRESGAHPRSRGENVPFGVGVASRTGSSPLTRGKPRPRATLRR